MADEKQSIEIAVTFATLKQLLKSRGFGYGEIAEGLGVSERTVRRWFSNGGVTIEQLEKLCALVELSVFDLWELASRKTEFRPKRLTARQELELSEDPVSIFVFTHLLSGWSPAEIEREANVPKASMVMALSNLERLGLIENFPGDHVKILTAREIEWHESGPMKRHVTGYINHHFRDMDASEPRFVCTTGSLKLSMASVAEIEGKFRKLAAKIRHLAHLDMSRAGNDKRWYAVLLAARSKVFGKGLFQ